MDILDIFDSIGEGIHIIPNSWGFHNIPRIIKNGNIREIIIQEFMNIIIKWIRYVPLAEIIISSMMIMPNPYLGRAIWIMIVVFDGISPVSAMGSIILELKIYPSEKYS